MIPSENPSALGDDPGRLESASGGPKGFRFECTLCGDCCTGGQVVRLTGGDLSLLVGKLGLGSVGDLRTAGLVVLVREPAGLGHFVWRPRLRFRTRPIRQCPFLENHIDDAGIYRGLCSLHPDFKPLVCVLSPLARTVDDAGSGPVTEAWSVVPPVEGCPGFGRGPELSEEPAPSLVARLAEEVRWMRRLVAQTPLCPDEDAAWAMVAEESAR